VTTPTLRRLDDRERYWGLTWPGWLAILAGFGALYAAVRMSPVSTKPTITITLIVLTFVAMVLHGVSGQALSPGRQLLAILRYHRSPKLLALADRADRRGLVLDAAPGFSADPTPVIDPETHTSRDSFHPAPSTPRQSRSVGDRLHRLIRRRPGASPANTDSNPLTDAADDRDYGEQLPADPAFNDELERLFVDNDPYGDL
jgi:hypothetical protein